MQDLNDKITGGTLTATEWNEVPSEIQNVIEGLGQTLSSGDLDQLGKGIAGYVANGIYYTDSGIADAYVLAKIGSKQAPTAYADGFRASFIAGNSNTGAATVNIVGLGVKNIKVSGGGNPSPGDISGRTLVTFDSANDWFEIIDARFSGQAKKAATVASMVADTSLLPGYTVETRGYYDGWAASLEPQGNAPYSIATLAEVRAENSDGAWVPDNLVNHTLANGSVAMLSFSRGKISWKQGGAKGIGTDDTLSINAVYAYATKVSKGITRFEIPVGDGRITSNTKPTVHAESGKYLTTASITTGGGTITTGDRAYLYSETLTYPLFSAGHYNQQISGLIFDGGTSHIYLTSSTRNIESAIVHIHDCEFRVAKEYCIMDDVITDQDILKFAYPANVYINDIKSYGSSFLSVHNNGTFVSDSWLGWDVSSTGTDDNPLFEGGTPLVLTNITDVPFGTNTNRTPRIRQTGSLGVFGPRSLHLTCKNYRFGGEATQTPIIGCDIEDAADCDIEFDGCTMFGVADFYWAEFENNLPRRLVVKNCKGTDSVDSTGFTNCLGIRVGTSVDPLDSKYSSYIEFGDDVPSRAQRFIITDTRTGSAVPNDAVSANFIFSGLPSYDGGLDLENQDKGNGFRVDQEPYQTSGGGAVGGTVDFGQYSYRRYDFQDPTENLRITLPGFTPEGGEGIYSCSIDVLCQNGTATYEGGMQRAAGGVLTNTITVGGTFSGSDGSHLFKMASTSGSGVGLSGALTIASNTVTSIDSIVSGSGFAATDTAVLTILSASESVACTLTIDSITSASASPRVITTANGMCEINNSRPTWKVWYNGTDPVDVTINITSVASAANTQIGIGRFYINKGGVLGGFSPANIALLERSNRMHSGNGSPSTGTWERGAIVLDANPSVGSPIGYMCTVAGSPGTWVAMANL